ncbi:DNA-3-methyladenine glycosylase 2 family protein [Paracoccus suum]|uniref:DNA-3-methyladenine glycosylase II n=1 Tax=Paracoccus suum TaxID=2259340 RepID=A0A344PKQ5_9RHOB|nr:DNA-3-methyladenine glycosylase [Paracoccus suum]AXC49960.1 DNA-3-methyladenine glycosylase 2 family protein [Paracoccus suum]
MSLRLIETEEDLAEGAAHLAAVCPVWARVLPELGPLPLRRRADGFAALVNAIVAQQISTASAAATSGRIVAAGLMDEAAVRAADDAQLLACGLSRPKLRYIRALAEAQMDWAGLRDLPDEEVTVRLTALPGIGRWTADIYLAFALGRADAFAPGDLALQESARLMYDLPARPGPAAIEAMAEAWRPWRSVAARGLWHYYLGAKGREGVRA